jgi:hypothetical protein
MLPHAWNVLSTNTPPPVLRAVYMHARPPAFFVLIDDPSIGSIGSASGRELLRLRDLRAVVYIRTAWVYRSGFNMGIC